MRARVGARETESECGAPSMQNDHQLSVQELEQKYRTSATKVSWGRQRGGCREGEEGREENIRKGQTGLPRRSSG